jgi:membrane protein required for colicin V production
MNNTITFVDEENIEDSLLYKPVKGLAPMIFPSIIKSDDETLDEDNDIIDPAEETNDVQA